MRDLLNNAWMIFFVQSNINREFQIVSRFHDLEEVEGEGELMF